MSDPRALLLTDVVDSTLLTARLGDVRMAEVWVAHDRAVRDLLPRWRGVEADRTDGFLLLFATVGEALGFAADFHRAMAGIAARFDLPFAARVGVHWGPVILLETPEPDRARGAKPLEVEGAARSVVERIMSLAGAGRTLLSREARNALEEGALISHGWWMQVGEPEPFEIFEAAPDVAEALPESARTWRVLRRGEDWLPAAEGAHTLPGEPNELVGRGSELGALKTLVDAGARLLTVSGPAGTGKTRLVTRFGHAWRGRWPGGVWFCDLAEARDLHGIETAVAAGLGIALGGGGVERLGHAIAGRGMCLVILDNFEQVSSEAPGTLGRWLDEAREASFLVTSRELLGLPGERVTSLQPLSEDDAVTLFLARAREARPDFDPSPADGQFLVQLVHLLDGLPLAIELAAARMGEMSPSELVRGMDERFRLLGAPGQPRSRQATLQGALDWSWELLGEDERRALAQLSVFEGGFTLEAAEAVIVLQDAWAMDAVQALVDHSLVRREGDERFGMLVSIQAYAAEKLDASGGRAGAEERHGAYFAELARPFVGEEPGERTPAHELDNLLAASRRAAARAEGPTAALTALAVAGVLEVRGPAAAALEPVERALAVVGEGTAHHAALLRLRGLTLALLGRLAEGEADYRLALEAHRLAGDLEGEAVSRVRLGRLLAEDGRNEEAGRHYEQALLLARQTGARNHEALALGALALLRVQMGRAADARPLFESALATFRDLADRRREADTLTNLGRLEVNGGSLEAAQRMLDGALGIFRELGDEAGEAKANGYLGFVHHSRRELTEAEACFRRTLQLGRKLGRRVSEAAWLINVGVVCCELGRLEEARAHLAQALAIHRQSGTRIGTAVALTNLGRVAFHLGDHDQAEVHYEEAISLHREVGARQHEGITHGLLARVHHARGRPAAARRAFTKAMNLLQEVGSTLELAKVHAMRAAFQAAEDLQTAAADLAEAERTAATHGGAGELDALIREAREALGRAGAS